jgi:MATE family multidrug resistance protein
MLNRAGLVLMLFIDTMIVGHVATIEQARFGAALIPVIVLQVVAVGLLIGVIVRTADADGGGRPARCGQIWRLGLILALVVGLFYAAILSLGAPILSHALDQPAPLAEAAGPVLAILGWGLPGLLVFATCAHVLEGLNRPNAPLVVMIGANVVNAGLAYALAFGWPGVPGQGALGVAIATTVSRWAMGGAGVLIVLWTRDAGKFGLSLRFTQGLAGMGDLLRLGVPLAAAIGLETLCFSAIINMGSWISEEAIATMSAAINFTALLYMLTTGLATAASVRVANALSRGDHGDAAAAGWVATGLIGLVMCMAAGLTFQFGQEIAEIYTADQKVVAILSPLLAGVISVLLIADGLQGVLMGALRGAADTLWPTLIYGVSFWVFGVPFAYIWGYKAGGGPNGLTWSLVIALAVAMVALGWRFYWLMHRAKVY